MLSILKNENVARFEKLYYESYSDLCRSVYRFVRDEDLTKDIVQEVFVKFWKKFNETKITDSPIAYLRRACVNQALNYLKEKERRATRENDFGNFVVESAKASERPDVKYETDETSRKIRQAIDRLPPMCKSAFLLSRHEKKSYKEIASALDISINTVEKHIGKALKILRKSLQGKQSE
ncbi:MAG: RNA polymerase sigma-70 factor [Cytophagales bacterium]|nr:RNA polymerase sigma-70 factor [Cytophagales bacterium]